MPGVCSYLLTLPAVCRSLPVPLPNLSLPFHSLPHLYPLPALAPSRFGSQLLGLAPDEPLPSLQQLEAALLGEAAPPPAPAPAPDAMAVDGEGGAAAEEGDGSPPPDAAVKLQMALADFLVAGLFQDTAAAIVGELAVREGMRAMCLSSMDLARAGGPVE